MRTIVRVGLIAGGVGFVALYASQVSVALIVAVGVVGIGLVAGLGTAKWLESAWFGRQLTAGLRTGLFACGLSGLGALLSLLILGPHDVTTLALRSHLARLDLAPWAHALAPVGWIGVDLVSVLAAVAAGVVVAALAAQIVAWSKSSRALRVVAQARQAAQSLNRDDPWRPTSGIPALGLAAPVTGALGFPTGAPAPSLLAYGTSTPSGGVPIPGMATAGVPSPQAFAPPPPPFPAHMPTPQAQPAPVPPGSSEPAAETALTEPAVPAVNTPKADAPTGAKPRASSRARPADKQLTDAMREALATWAGDNSTAEKPAGSTGARTPKASSYLNSSPPAPKRARKKQNTRDWLC